MPISWNSAKGNYIVQINGVVIAHKISFEKTIYNII